MALQIHADVSHQIGRGQRIALPAAPASASTDLHLFTTGSSGLLCGKRLTKVTPCDSTTQGLPERLLQQR